MWDYVLLFWAFLNDIGGVLGWIGGACALALSVANTFRLNRQDEEFVRVSEQLYELQDDAGIGPGGSWAARHAERTRH